MSDRPDKLEQMLRRWGAQQAAREADVPPLGENPRQRSAGAWPVTFVWRWAPAAAAAALLIVAGGVAFLGTSSMRKAAPEAAQRRVEAPVVRPAAPAPAAEADGELRRVRGELLAAQAALGEQVKKHEKEMERFGEDVARARADANAWRTQAEKLKHQVAGLDEDARELAAKVETLQKEREESQRRIAELDDRRKKAEDERAKLVAAAEKAELEAKRSAVAESAFGEAQQELASLKLRHAESQAALRRAYMAAAAPGQSGLAAVQTAARKARMAARAGELRAPARAAATGELLDRLEVAFTRLAILDATDAAAAEGFAKLLAGGQAMERIDAVLAARQEPAAVRDYLLEAKLMLMGV